MVKLLQLWQNEEVGIECDMQSRVGQGEGRGRDAQGKKRLNIGYKSVSNTDDQSTPQDYGII